MAHISSTPLRRVTTCQETRNPMQEMHVDLREMNHEITRVGAEVAEMKSYLNNNLEQKLDNIMSTLADILTRNSQKKTETTVNINSDDGVNEENKKIGTSIPSILEDKRWSSSAISYKVDVDNDDKEEEKTTNRLQEATESGLDQEDEAESSGPKRLPNGDFDLDTPYHRSRQNLTAQETKILSDWPHVILPSQVHRYGLKNQKTKIFFKTNLKLFAMDQTTLQVLYAFQEELISSMVPYRLWPMRLVSIMGDDFFQIAEWARSCYEVTWLDLVEAILQSMKRHHLLYNPMTCFENINMEDETDILSLFKRIRKIFYQLPKQIRTSTFVREGLKNKIREYIPWAFLFLGQKLDEISTANGIEEITNLLKKSNEIVLQFGGTGSQR